MEGLYEVTNALSIFWVAAIFILPVSPLRPPRRPFLPYFARAAQQSVLDGTNGLSSSEPCAYCRIVQICQKCQGASRGHLCESTAFFLRYAIKHKTDRLAVGKVQLSLERYSTYRTKCNGIMLVKEP